MLSIVQEHESSIGQCTCQHYDIMNLRLLMTPTITEYFSLTSQDHLLLTATTGTEIPLCLINGSINGWKDSSYE